MNDDSSVVNEALRIACERRMNLLDTAYLCQSVGGLPSRSFGTVTEVATMGAVVTRLRELSSGCVMVVDAGGMLIGIFSERDLVQKVDLLAPGAAGRSVGEVMTRDPITVTADATVAYALNLMSHGGFRHLPVIDGDGKPIALLSVKDLVDHIVTSFTEQLLGIPEVS